MTFFKWFHQKKNNSNSAQALVYMLMVLLVLICFISFVLNGGRTINWKIKMQNCADASALSGAIWQARALNLIAALNDVLILCYSAITGMVLAIGASKGALLVVLAPKIAKTYQVVKKIAKIQDIIKDTNPILVEGEVLRIARLNEIEGAIAIAPSVPPWPELHIHRPGTKMLDPGTAWEKGKKIIHYSPSDSGINTIVPLPYVRDDDFDTAQYVFSIAFDEPGEIISPGKNIFRQENPALLRIPEINFAGNRIGGDVGYITVAQAKPVNSQEPAPLLLLPQWDVKLSSVTAFGDIPVPGLSKIAELLQQEFIIH